MQNLDVSGILDLYRQGKFPMADAPGSPYLSIIEPEFRGIIPLNGLHISRSLAKFIKKTDLTVSVDTAFDHVVSACAKTRPREGGGTWISAALKDIYSVFFAHGHAHSVEVWEDGGTLVGGLFGVCIGGAFFGESMFSRTANASKLALVHLVAQLNTAGYRLLDTQYMTDHLESLGGIEISQQAYLKRLEPALKAHAAPLITGRSQL